MLKKHFPEHYELLCRKGVYPYEWVDQGLPSMKSFYSSLNQEGITENDYKHATNVYNKLNCSSFKDYHLAYLKTDVLLLTDIFEKFRKVCMEYYKLDPTNYISSPGLAWDAMLLKTGIELDLITNLEILNLIEKMKRGGLCYVGSKRYVKANNKYIEGFDINQPSNFLMYWDANNLYGWAMSQVLPYKNIQFDTKVKLKNILNTADNSKTGYIVECDLHFPEHLHDKFKEYPPAPENLTPNIEWFSDFQKDLGKKLNVINKNDRYTGTNKLIPHLMDHNNYVLHYRNLKFLVSLGVEITNIHKVIRFEQKPWLKPYIDFNTKKRKEAKNEFEKRLFQINE